MSAPERRLAIRRCFSGLSLVDELERLFIDHDRDVITTPWPGVMPLVARTGEGERDRCGRNCVDSRQLATQKKTTTKKRLQVSHTKSAHSSQVNANCDNHKDRDCDNGDYGGDGDDDVR